MIQDQYVKFHIKDLKCISLRFIDLRSRGGGKTDRIVKEDIGEKST